MTNITSWLGPASYNPAGIIPKGSVEHNISCRHVGIPSCSSLADSWKDHEGRRLPAMLASFGLSEDEVGELYIGAYSAGGSVAKRLAENEQDRRKIRVMHLADATYTSQWESAAARRPPPIRGFVEYALDAIDGPHLLVATASPIPNGYWASGVENLTRLREEIEKRSGQKFEKIELAIAPLPEAAYELGNVILAEYPYAPLGHSHQQLARQIWHTIILPWLDSPESKPDVSGVGPAAIATTIGGIVGFMLGKIV